MIESTTKEAKNIPTITSFTVTSLIESLIPRSRHKWLSAIRAFRSPRREAARQGVRPLCLSLPQALHNQVLHILCKNNSQIYSIRQFWPALMEKCRGFNHLITIITGNLQRIIIRRPIRPARRHNHLAILLHTIFNPRHMARPGISKAHNTHSPLLPFIIQDSTYHIRIIIIILPILNGR